MKTEAQKDAFRALLTAAGLSHSSPRAHSAMAAFKDENDLLSQEDLIDIAVKNEAVSRQSWIDTALEPWCKRHGITMKQGLSIMARDDAYNPDAPHTDLVTFKSLFEWSGQQNAFAEHLLREMKDADAAPSGSEIEDKWKIFGFNRVISNFDKELDMVKLYNLLMECGTEEEIDAIFEEHNMFPLEDFENKGHSNEDLTQFIFELADEAQKIANEKSPEQESLIGETEKHVNYALRVLSDMAITNGHDFVSPETLGAALKRLREGGGALACLADACDGLKAALKILPSAPLNGHLANAKVSDLSGSALDRAVSEVYGAPVFTALPVYTNECVLPSQEQIIQVDAQMHSGWLYHDKHKTYYALFANLGDCLSRTNPLKEWAHNSDFESFEEEVIDTWLVTGVDVEAEAASNAPTGDKHGG
jgi:hypothetical protein